MVVPVNNCGEKHEMALAAQVSECLAPDLQSSWWPLPSPASGTLQGDTFSSDCYWGAGPLRFGRLDPGILQLGHNHAHVSCGCI